MSMETTQLQPESLSESTLLEILKTRCIEIADVKSMKKTDLMEMYRKIALPLPQRSYNEDKPFGRWLSQLRLNRKVPIDVEEDYKLFKATYSSQELNKSNIQGSECERLQERERISNKRNGILDNWSKRKNDDTEISAEETGVKKRLKITWP